MNNWLDIIIVVVGVIFIGMGFRSGIVGLVTTVFGLVASGLAAWFFNDVAAEQLAPYIANSTIARIVGFLLVGAIVFGLFRLIGNLIRTFLSVLLLGWVDRAAGAAVGLVIAVLVAGGFVWVLNLVPLDATKEAIAESAFAPRVTVGLKLITEQVSENLEGTDLVQLTAEMPPKLMEKLNDPAVSELLGSIPVEELASSLLAKVGQTVSDSSSFEIPSALKELFNKDPVAALQVLRMVLSDERLQTLGKTLLGDQAGRTVQEVLAGPHSEALEQILGKDYEQLLQQLPDSLDDATLEDLLTAEDSPLLTQTTQ